MEEHEPHEVEADYNETCSHVIRRAWRAYKRGASLSPTELTLTVDEWVRLLNNDIPRGRLEECYEHYVKVKRGQYFPLPADILAAYDEIRATQTSAAENKRLRFWDGEQWNSSCPICRSEGYCFVWVFGSSPLFLTNNEVRRGQPSPVYAMQARPCCCEAAPPGQKLPAIDHTWVLNVEKFEYARAVDLRNHGAPNASWQPYVIAAQRAYEARQSPSDLPF